MLTLCVLALLNAEPSTVDEAPAAEGTSSERSSGGVFAPAALPAGSNAIYGFVGAPEVGAGYRQGFGLVEFEVRGTFNLFEVSVIGEVALKISALRLDKIQLAPLIGLGLEFNSGATYFDAHNFAFVGLRPKVGLLTSYAFTDTISGVAQLEFPVSIALNVQGFQVTPTVLAGAEFYLADGLSLVVAGLFGFDATKEPLGVTQYRVAWGGRLGLGYRIF